MDNTKPQSRDGQERMMPVSLFGQMVYRLTAHSKYHKDFFPQKNESRARSYPALNRHTQSFGKKMSANLWSMIEISWTKLKAIKTRSSK